MYDDFWTARLHQFWNNKRLFGDFWDGIVELQMTLFCFCFDAHMSVFRVMCSVFCLRANLMPISHGLVLPVRIDASLMWLFFLLFYTCTRDCLCSLFVCVWVTFSQRVWGFEYTRNANASPRACGCRHIQTNIEFLSVVFFRVFSNGIIVYCLANVRCTACDRRNTI